MFKQQGIYLESRTFEDLVSLGILKKEGNRINLFSPIFGAYLTKVAS